MKKVLKWTAIVFCGLIAVLIFSGLILYPIGKKKLTRFYPDIPVESIAIPSDADAIAHGQHVAIIWSCTKCHGPDLSGMLLVKDPLSGLIPIGEVPAPNLTPGKGGAGQYYTDKDWVRSIRHGIKPNLQGIAFMNYSMMNDLDLGALIAYLKQIPPVDKGYPAIHYGTMVPIIYATGFFTPGAQQLNNKVPQPAPGVTAEYGSYLSSTCRTCHGKTIDNTFKSWKKENFIRTFHTGILPNGKNFGPTMSSQTFRELTDLELNALWLYYTGIKN